MRIKCLHGYFIFEESRAGDVSRFASYWGLSIEPKNDYYTFTDLIDAPDYSFIGVPYLGAQTSVVYAGGPWHVMRVNKLVYDFNLGLVKPISTITQKLTLTKTANYFVSSGLILPGSLTDEGMRVTDYSAWYSFDTLRFKYTEVLYASL